jgi:uncharacterized protein (DUF486 family)
MVLFKATILLILSNVFMTYAWYGHLKDKTTPLITAVLLAWGVAFFEYCLQVPANRIGSQVLSAPQLKCLQEAITFIVFSLFSYFYLKDRPTLYDHLSFALIMIAVMISLFQPRTH